MTIGSTEVTVTTGGTAVQLSTSSPTLVNWFRVIGKAANTNQVYIGDSAVDSTVNDGIDAGEERYFPPAQNLLYDLSTIYLDADTDGEGVELYYG